MDKHNKELFEQIENVLREQKTIEKKLNSITKELNVNEQQLNDSSNFLLSTSKQLFTNKINLIKEKKFTENLFETINALIVTYDTEGRIKRFNSFAEKITGYTEHEVIGINWFEHFIPEEDKEKMRNNISSVLNNSHESNSIENKIICKDGTIKKIDWVYTPINIGNYKEKHVLSIGIDITKRKIIEDTLEKERKLFSAGPVTVLTWLPKSGWPIKNVSSNIEKVLGYTVKEVTATDFYFDNLIHADDKERISNEVHYYIKNHISTFEQSYRLKHKNGQYRWFYDFTNLIYDEHHKLFEIRGYVFDQTVLKQSEDEIKSQKQRLNHIINSTKLGTWEWNIINNKFIINEQWANIIGYTLEELSPITTATWSSFVHPQDLIKSNELLDKHISGELDYYSFQCRMKHKDGHWVCIEDKGMIHTWTYDGKPEWMFGTHQDISDRRSNERELKKALDKAKESDQLKSAFISNISHEIRTPLNGILGVVNLISNDLVSKEELIEFKQYMEISSERLMNTINNLVEMAQITENQVTISLSNFNLNTLIEEIFISNKDLIETQKLKFSLHKGLPDNEAFISCDSDKIKTILSNFIDNALKFTESGGIEVGYKLIEDNQENKIEFFIVDTGSGIPIDKQKEIYKYFIQAENDYSRKYQGVGLGLSINKALIEMMGGIISLDSKVGEGTRFSFTTPYNKAN